MGSNLNTELWWTTKAGPPRTHYGARRGEHPRYAIRREVRSGAPMWIVFYRLGTLNDIELSVAADTLRKAQRIAVEDLDYRVAIGEVPRLQTGGQGQSERTEGSV